MGEIVEMKNKLKENATETISTMIESLSILFEEVIVQQEGLDEKEKTTMIKNNVSKLKKKVLPLALSCVENLIKDVRKLRNREKIVELKDLDNVRGKDTNLSYCISVKMEESDGSDSVKIDDSPKGISKQGMSILFSCS